MAMLRPGYHSLFALLPQLGESRLLLKVPFGRGSTLGLLLAGLEALRDLQFYRLLETLLRGK